MGWPPRFRRPPGEFPDPSRPSRRSPANQAAGGRAVDLRLSLGNTATVSKSKARARSITVTVTVEPDLPRVRGFVGELNQVWANLIDNALDACHMPSRSCMHTASGSASWCGWSTMALAFRRSFAHAYSTRSSRPSRLASAQAWDSISSGA